MRKDDANRLRHTRDAAREAIDFARDRARSELDTDRMLVLALIKDVEVIGEAAMQVSDETRRQLPEIPWADIVGMRHRPVHAYFDINLEILWQTVQQDLPPLLGALEKVLERE